MMHQIFCCWSIESHKNIMCLTKKLVVSYWNNIWNLSFILSKPEQGGRTWQAFGGGKHGHETFRQAHNYNFRDKCIVFARNLKFSNLTQ